MALSAICGVASFLTVIYHGPEQVLLFEWIAVGSFESEWTLRVDALTGVMFFVVSFVSFLIHVYSLGYMEGAHDPHIPRFMCYLSMFTFFMLMLVSSDSLVQLFFGWEGVGLASYLLIGFWYTRPAANAAAIKAFIVNRVADFAFMLGIAAAFMVFDSVQFDTIFADAAQHQADEIVVFGTTFEALDVVAFLLFIGAMGKSAQLGLHTWLPDAMEGPTPVSALIHAATMVTAGVFLVARMSPVFEYAPDVLAFVAFIGGSTAFFAATIAVVQTDIKRVVAYSTCSQLGYMFAACGVSAYPAAIFHLGTHAFFKSLLFLSAGSVITALHEEQDMRNMGGLWRKLPITYAVMFIGSLALAGIPFFAGYYSKDFILEATWASQASFAHFAYWAGTLGAGLTALYIFRLMFMTFHGTFRQSDEAFAKIHESPWVMTIPLMVARVRRGVRRHDRRGPDRARHGDLGRLDLRAAAEQRARGGASHPGPGPAPAADPGDRRHRDRVRDVHPPARPGRRWWWPRSSRSTSSWSTNGTSTSCTTSCSCARRCGSATICGSAAIAA